MKKLSTLFILLCQCVILNAQTKTLVVFVKDCTSNQETANAKFTVKELGFASKISGSDGKILFENMPIGEIRYEISLKGYQSKAGAFNITTEEKSNTLEICLEISKTSDLLIFGELTNTNQMELINGNIEVRYGDIVKRSRTDSSGNYFVKIPVTINKYNVQKLTIEASCQNCRKEKKSIDIPLNNSLQVDFILKCVEEEDLSLKYNNLLLSYCKSILNFQEIPEKEDMDKTLDLYVQSLQNIINCHTEIYHLVELNKLYIVDFEGVKDIFNNIIELDSYMNIPMSKRDLAKINLSRDKIFASCRNYIKIHEK